MSKSLSDRFIENGGFKDARRVPGTKTAADLREKTFTFPPLIVSFTLQYGHKKRVFHISGYYLS